MNYYQKKFHSFAAEIVIIKLQEDGIKMGVQNKAGLKIPQPSLQAMPVKHLCTSRPAGREIDQVSMRKTLKKITNAIRKTHSYTEHDKN
jgi:hypothetical protein